MSELLDGLVTGFSVDQFSNVLRKLNPDFVPQRKPLQIDDTLFGSAETLGVMEFTTEGRSLVVTAMSVQGSVDEKRGRKQQYDQAKKILRSMPDRDAGLFVFYDTEGRFRLSFVHEVLSGARRRYSSYRRFTFFVDKDYSNKTFKSQLTGADFSKFSSVQNAFSVAAVSQDFYSEFLSHFDAMEKDIFAKAELKKADDSMKDFALLFAIRVIFLGFVQKRGWLADDQEFLPHFFKEYVAVKAAKKAKPDSFYDRWLKPLFHEALNSAPGRQVAYQNNDWSEDSAKRLQMLPWLDGGLFQERALDRKGYSLSDKTISDFFEFLFSYNFTIEENTLDDNELGLNPEFLGIIFERLINKENGAVYTPRTEVDFMCRTALVQWLLKKLNGKAEKEQLYKLFFKERHEEHQSDGTFTTEQAEYILALLSDVAICDPAVGSGAFPVGMLHVIEEIQLSLLRILGRESEAADLFSFRKNIIFNSLHGVDVAEWAVWICQLRLWITLFIDAPDALRMEFEPILPALDFKMRVGDSLVQRVGSKLFPVEGYPAGGRAMQNKIRELKKLKRDYFDKPHTDRVRLQHQETSLYADIIGAEIKEKTDELKNYRNERDAGAQSQLFVGKTVVEKSAQRHLFEERIEALETHIADLRSKADSLLKDRPLVWGIEFADIFSDRGGFDVVIGNPPYIRQESIGDPMGKLSNVQYKAALKDMVGLDFPNWDKKVDGKSDLFAYFYVHGLKLLNDDGVHVFICSNSWLDVGYGTWLQEFLVSKAPLEFVFDNQAKRSFAEADINTIISVISAPRKTVDDEHVSRFVAFRKPYEEVILTEILLGIDNSDALQKNENFRIYPICNRELVNTGSEIVEAKTGKKMFREYTGDKWGGKYLKAPDIYYDLLKKAVGNISSLGDYCEGERYLNTGGADGFFILTEVAVVDDKLSEIINHNTAADETLPFSGRIESKFLRPLIKDALKKEKTISVKETDAFCLVIEGEPTALLKNYISWGEAQEYDRRSVTKNSNPWYKPTRQMLDGASLLVPRSFSDTFAIHYNPKKFLSLRFYRLHPNVDAKMLAAYMNSTLFWFFFEALGNKSQGQGVLDFFMADFLKMRIPIVLDKKLIPAFEALSQRPIENVFLECGVDLERDSDASSPQPKNDRLVLDDLVFDVLGLSKVDRTTVYTELCKMVSDRLKKAQSTSS